MNNLSSTFTIDDLREIAYRGSYRDSERALARELLALREAQSKAVAVVELSDYFVIGEERKKAVRELYEGAFVVGQYLYAAPQLPAVPEGAEERLSAAVELLKQAAPHMLADESLKDPDGALAGKLPAMPDGEMLRRWVAFGRAMEKSGSTLPRHLIAETEAMIAAAPKPE